MACPKKFADLHKSCDDAFGKDFCHGAFNVEVKQAADAGDMAKGSITFKVNHNPLTGSTTSNCEAKATLGNSISESLSGIVVTRSLSGAGLLKNKYEYTCGAGSKTAYDFDFDLATKANKKGNFELTYGCNKAAIVLKVAQGEGVCAAPTTVNANAVVAAADDHRLGVNVDYNIASGAVSHAVKYNTGCPWLGNFSLGLANAENVSMCMSKPVGQELCIGPFGSMNVANIHAKADYGINSGKYGVALCAEGSYKLGDFKTGATKMVYNPVTGDFKESHKIKITDALSATVAFASNAHNGIFTNASMGATLNFSV